MRPPLRDVSAKETGKSFPAAHASRQRKHRFGGSQEGVRKALGVCVSDTRRNSGPGAGARAEPLWTRRGL